VEDLSPAPIALRRRQDDGVTTVTGITGLGVQPRLEIRELQQNEDQWNLYLLGLARFQAVNESEKLSYYQIAGQPVSPLACMGSLIWTRHSWTSLCSMGWRATIPWH